MRRLIASLLSCALLATPAVAAPVVTPSAAAAIAEFDLSDYLECGISNGIYDGVNRLYADTTD